MYEEIIGDSGIDFSLDRHGNAYLLPAKQPSSIVRMGINPWLHPDWALKYKALGDKYHSAGLPIYDAPTIPPKSHLQDLKLTFDAAIGVNWHTQWDFTNNFAFNKDNWALAQYSGWPLRREGMNPERREFVEFNDDDDDDWLDGIHYPRPGDLMHLFQAHVQHVYTKIWLCFTVERLSNFAKHGGRPRKV